jgi:serine/threonine protein kinase
MPLLTTGTRLGPYEILASLGQGAMGEVYKAHDTRLQRSVAVKVLPASLADDPDRRARFEREARAVAKLDHPHVCGIYDVGEALGMHYLVMPLLEGETLATRLERGPLPIDVAMRIAIDLADGLHAAHRLGVVHRDLKPANIFLVRRSAGSAPMNAKLLDFGLAKLRASSAAYASDQSGQYEIYVQEFPSGTQRTISIGGGMQPQWRRDGHELYYLAPDGSLMHVAVNAGERLTTTAPKVLFKTLIPPVLNPYRMDYVPAVDGQRFLMKVPLNRDAPVITVVLNWPALLDR